jgi:hypothetical protein
MEKYKSVKNGGKIVALQHINLKLFYNITVG